MYTLYWSADSGAFAVQAVLEELGQPYQREIVATAAGEHRTPGFLALNPMAQVPTLRLPGRHGDHRIGGHGGASVRRASRGRRCCRRQAPARARGAYRWLFWLATGLYEADLRYFYPDRYTADPAGLPMACRTAALARMDRLLAIAEDLLAPGPYVLGERFSAVDLYLFMLALWHPAGTEVHAPPPRLGELMRLVRRRPAVERIWAQHYPAEETARGRPGPARARPDPGRAWRAARSPMASSWPSSAGR